MTIPYQKAVFQGDSILGNIPILDVQYGNVWTNINDSILNMLHVEPKEKLEVKINRNSTPVFDQDVEFVHTFGDVPEGKTLAYLNSLLNLSLAINKGNMADSFHINSGAEWNIVVKRKKPN
jgi:S-adenosylmethionine hydrolase